MSNYNYKQAYWLIDVGAGDIGAQARAQIAKAALALNVHQDVVILALSSGGHATGDHPQIALTVAIDYDETTLTAAVESALAAEGLAAKATLQSDLRQYELGAVELSNVAEATKVADVNAARQAIEELFALPLEPISAENANVSAGEDPAKIESFSVLEGRMNTLRDAAGMLVAKEIGQLLDVFKSIRDFEKAKISDIVTSMVTRGIVTIGAQMYKEYTTSSAPWGRLVTFLSYLIEKKVTLPKLREIVRGIIGAAESVLGKNGVDVLLLVNDQKSTIDRGSAYSPQGAQCVASVPLVEPMYPRRTKMSQPAVFPCGFYIYHLPQETGSLNSCCMGIEFNFPPSAEQFAVGMNCSLDEEKLHSIRVTNKDALVAADLAMTSERTSDVVTLASNKKITVTRARDRASVNYGIAYVD